MNTFQVAAERIVQGSGKDRAAVLIAFPFADDQLAGAEIKILDP